MRSKKNPPHKGAVEEALRLRKEREKSYRERALKLFPHICARCGREFRGKRLRELTVHHRDHDHDNNPPDGSNWELLCIYCHENEHNRHQVADTYNTGSGGETAEDDALTHQPFSGLADLLAKNKEPQKK